MLLTLCWPALGLLAQEPIPTTRILPEDVVQTSIQQLHAPGSTNLFTVRWRYTEAGAKKMLAFWRAHAGEEVLQQVGDFECRPTISTARPPNWTEEGWLKYRTDKFIAVTADDAKKIIAGMRATGKDSPTR